MTDKEKDFLEGVVIAAACEFLRRKKNKPLELISCVEILKQLPKFPEWDKEKYPHAILFIGMPLFSSAYMLFFCETIENNNGAVTTPAGSLRSYIEFNSGGLKSDSWTVPTAYAYTSGTSTLSDIYWANFDVLNEDGSVYLAASEPVFE